METQSSLDQSITIASSVHQLTLLQTACPHNHRIQTNLVSIPHTFTREPLAHLIQRQPVHTIALHLTHSNGSGIHSLHRHTGSTCLQPLTTRLPSFSPAPYNSRSSSPLLQAHSSHQNGHHTHSPYRQSRMGVNAADGKRGRIRQIL